MVSSEDRFEPTGEEIAIVSTVPQNGATGVDPRAQFDICFSAPVDPRAVEEFDARLTSGVVTYDTELTLQLFPWRPPGQRDGINTEDWCPGSVLSVRAKSELIGGLLYRLRLAPTASGWAGESLDTTTPGWSAVDEETGSQSFFLEFTVEPDDPDDPDEPDDPDPIGLSELFEPGEIFDPLDGACGCHQREDELARDLLDLSTPQIAFGSLVLDTRARSTGSPLVAQRRPSNSYLIQKLQRTDEGHALLGVLGEAMPLEGSVSVEQMSRLAVWIATGAAP